MKVALVYDRVNKWGGAERILLNLHKIFPKAPLYTSVYNPKKAPWAEVFDIRTSFLQKIPKASKSHEYYAALMPIAFEKMTFDDYDLVISVTSEAAKGIITNHKTLHICYCLTPTRYLWSGYKDYFKNPLFKRISKPAIYYLRKWDKIASKRPDFYLAISKEVKRRIKKYYNRDSIVVYPSVELDLTETKKEKINFKHNSYFLIVSRLVPYKKIDLAIQAFNILGLPLKIIGIGSEEKKLKSMAKSNIEFLGDLTDNRLVSYYRGCRSLIFPGEEDFGLTILEAQIFNKPVIAFKRGGALETVIEGKTGKFFYPQNKEALVEALKQIEKIQFNINDFKKQTEKFRFEQFKKNFIVAIDSLLKKHKL